MTGFAFEHSLSSSHPPHEGNNLKIKVFIKLLGSLGHTLGGLRHPFDCKASPLQTCFWGSFLICSGSLLSSRSPKNQPAIHQQPEALKPSRAARCFQGLITHFQCESPSILQTNTLNVAIRWNWSPSNQSEMRGFRLRHLATSPPRSGSLLCHERSKSRRTETS